MLRALAREGEGALRHTPVGTISWRRRLRREFAFLACGFCLGALIFSTLANGRPATPPSRLDYPSRVDYAAAEPTPAGVPHATPAETPAGGDAGAPADAPAPQCPGDDTWAASLDKDAPRIVYSVLTGQRHHRTRVPAVQQTWARHISVRDALVFYSDRQEAAVPSVGLSPPANERIYSAGAWRNFPALAHLHDHRAEFGCFDWVFFCDDDTYVFPRALEQVLYRHRASESKYLGVYHTARVDLEWQDPEAHIAYAHGGAGYILSWTLLRKLRPLLDACHERYVNWAGDLRVSKCVTLLSVFVEEARGLHTEAPSHYQWVDEATVRRQKGLSEFATAEGGIRPATFHHLPAETLHDLEQAHRLAHTDTHGVEWERDFSELMFRDFAFACPEIPDDRSERPAVAAGQRCRLLFGFRVDHLTSRGRVHRLVAKAPDRNDEGDPATREYSPLYDKVTPPTFGANGTFVFALGTHAMWNAAAHRRRPTAQLALQHAPPAPCPGLQPRAASSLGPPAPRPASVQIGRDVLAGRLYEPALFAAQASRRRSTRVSCLSPSSGTRASCPPAPPQATSGRTASTASCATRAPWSRSAA